MSIRKPSRASPAWSFLGLLIAYFAFPVRWDESPVVVGASLLLTIGGLVLVGWMMVMELLHLRSGEESRSTRALAILLAVLVVGFSLTFFLIENISPHQIDELDTRIDALYFTLATMATVGYGDIHAVGQVARALVSAVILFDVVVVASLVRAQTARRAAEK